MKKIVFWTVLLALFAWHPVGMIILTIILIGAGSADKANSQAG